MQAQENTQSLPPEEPPSIEPNGEELITVDVTTSKGEVLTLRTPITIENVKKVPDVPTITKLIAEVRGSLTDSICWQRQLEYEMDKIRVEITQLSALQTALIIRDAELRGNIQVIPPVKTVPRDLTPYTIRTQSTAEMEAQALKKATKVISSLGTEDLKTFVESLLAAKFPKTSDTPKDTQ